MTTQAHGTASHNEPTFFGCPAPWWPGVKGGIIGTLVVLIVLWAITSIHGCSRYYDGRASMRSDWEKEHTAVTTPTTTTTVSAATSTPSSSTPSADEVSCTAGTTKGRSECVFTDKGTLGISLTGGVNICFGEHSGPGQTYTRYRWDSKDSNFVPWPDEPKYVGVVNIFSLRGNLGSKPVVAHYWTSDDPCGP
jgi:hypothetical protein